MKRNKSFDRVQVEDSKGQQYEKVFIISLTDDRTEDADMDGLTEAEEEDSYGTSDLDRDSDDDGFYGDEVQEGTDPTDQDDAPNLQSVLEQVLALMARLGSICNNVSIDDTGFHRSIYG